MLTKEIRFFKRFVLISYFQLNFCITTDQIILYTKFALPFVRVLENRYSDECCVTVGEFPEKQGLCRSLRWLKPVPMLPRNALIRRIGSTTLYHVLAIQSNLYYPDNFVMNIYKAGSRSVAIFFLKLQS